MPATPRDVPPTVLAVAGASSGVAAATACALVEAGVLVVGLDPVDRLTQLIDGVRVFGAPLAVQSPARRGTSPADAVQRFRPIVRWDQRRSRPLEARS